MKCRSFYRLNRNQSWCPPRVILLLGLLVGFVAAMTREVAAQLPALSISDVTKVEGDIGTAPMTFTITLSAPSSQFVTVHYSTQDGTASGFSDYTPVTDAVVVFSPGQTSKTIDVQIRGDTANEPNESFFVTLFNAQQAVLDQSVALGTILDDDAFPTVVVNNVSVTEGNSGTTNAVFNVQRTGNLTFTLVLNYSTSNGSATAGSDYVATNGVLVFAPRQTSKTISVPVIGDTLIEGDETFFVTLSSASSANLLTAKATIIDDEAVPLLSVNDASIFEGNSGTTLLLFPVILSARSAQNVTVTYSTTDGTAVAGSDYVSTSGTLTIPAGQLSGSITVPIVGDALAEPNETFFVNLTNATAAAIVRDQATGTIQNDDTIATFSIGNAVIAEGNSGITTMPFTVTLSGTSLQPVTVDYATLNGTAIAGSDYVPASGRLTFLPGQPSQTINVTINGDVVYEPDENFFVTLSNPTPGATLASSQATGLIQNDDSPPTLSISDAAVKEGDSGTVNAIFTVNLTGSSQQPVTVDFFTTGLTAAPDIDFVSTNGTLTFSSGINSLTVTVPVKGDTIPEPNETFVVNLSNPVNATLGNAVGLGTILDDDSGPALSISDAVIVEGNIGTTPVAFTVSLSSPGTQNILVHLSTSGQTAIGGIDYDPTPNPFDLLFLPGETNKTVFVNVIGNQVNELDKFFFVNLSNPTGGATIANGRGIGIILNDDKPPDISIDDVTVTEGNSGTTDAVFKVHLSAPAAQFVTVDYFTQDGTAQGNFSDYISTSGTLEFAPNETLKTITVQVLGDTVEEPDEFFNVFLINPSSNAHISDPSGQGTIINDDFVPRVSIGDVAVIEGDSGTTKAVFPVTLSVAAPSLTTIAYSTADGTATTTNLDYVATNGVVVFLPGSVNGSITVAVNGDTTIEPDETFFVNLGQVTGGQIIVTNHQAIGTIVNDDSPPPAGVLSISDLVSVIEGNTGTRDAIFTVTLSKPGSQPVTVDFTTSDGVAKAGLDYVATNGVLAFAPGETNKRISVPVIGDSLVEPDENFLVTLTNPQGATIDVDHAQGLGVIIDDDALANVAPTVSITSPANGATFTAPTNIVITSVATDSDGSIAKVEFFQGSLKLGQATSSPYNFTWSNVVAGNYALTAIATDNLGATTTSTPPVNILVNARPNSPPTVTITNPVDGATFTAPANIAIAAIANDIDGSIAKVEFFRDNIKLGETSVSPYSFAWSNVASGDYALTTKATDNLGATTTSTPVNVLVNVRPNSPPTVFIASPANGATLNEPANIVITVLANDTDGSIAKVEFFRDNIKLGETSASPYSFIWSNVAAGNFTVTAKATDNLGATATSTPVNVVVKQAGNLPPSLSIGDQAVTEGKSGTVPAVFSVRLSASNPLPVTVDYFTANDTALAGSDFVATNGTVIFMPGETNKTITVAVIGDTIAEETESFFVNLTNATNASISDGQGLGFITDDDSLPTIVITDTAVTEGDSGTTNAVFNVSLSAISGQIVTVEFATADDTAKAGSDYQPVSGTLTFNPGDTNKTIVVPVIGDLIGEPDESFFMNLTNAVNAALTDSQARGRITDNDSFPRFSISNAIVTEGNSGNANAVFTVSLSAASASPVSVNWATANGTATAPGDYLANSGTLTFAPGQTTGTITVVVNGDTINEADENFFVSLSNAVNAGISVGQGVGTIVDDDLPPSLLITDAVVSEGNSGTTTKLVFQVRLSIASGKTVSVDYATANGTATAGSDYQPTNGHITFLPGTNLQTVTVTVNGDDLVEPDETVLVNLSNAANATIGRGQGVGKILDDDEFPSLTVTDASVTEGNSGTTNAVFTVLLSIASSQTVTVDFTTVDGTATAGSDYIAVSRTISFPPGTTTTNVTVQVIGDTIQESDEFFNVRLTNAVNATIARGQGQGAIRNDDDVNSPPTQLELSITGALGGQPEIQLQGKAGTSYVVEASTNLVNWTTFTNVVATDALMRFPETRASNFRARYYRARQGP